MSARAKAFSWTAHMSISISRATAATDAISSRGSGSTLTFRNPESCGPFGNRGFQWQRLAQFKWLVAQFLQTPR